MRLDCSGWRRRAQGRPRDRTADLVIPRAPQVGLDRASPGARREGGRNMNLLVVGSWHRTADLPLLERLSVPAGATSATLGRLVAQRYVDEAVVLSTCNRVEIYAAVSAFHGGLADSGTALAAYAD